MSSKDYSISVILKTKPATIAPKRLARIVIPKHAGHTIPNAPKPTATAGLKAPLQSIPPTANAPTVTVEPIAKP